VSEKESEKINKSLMEREGARNAKKSLFRTHEMNLLVIDCLCVFVTFLASHCQLEEMFVQLAESVFLPIPSSHGFSSLFDVIHC
jgi:hypothetical protein